MSLAQRHVIHARYNASEKGQLRHARYDRSAKRRAAKARYNASKKGHAAQAKYSARRVFIGNRKIGMAATIEVASAVNAHIRRRVHAFREAQCR